MTTTMYISDEKIKSLIESYLKKIIGQVLPFAFNVNHKTLLNAATSILPLSFLD